MQGLLMDSGLKQVATANSINNSHHHRNYEGCKEIHQVHIPQQRMQLWRVVPPWILDTRYNRISQCVIATNMYVSQGWALVNQGDGLSNMSASVWLLEFANSWGYVPESHPTVSGSVPRCTKGHKLVQYLAILGTLSPNNQGIHSPKCRGFWSEYWANSYNSLFLN